MSIPINFISLFSPSLNSFYSLKISFIITLNLSHAHPSFSFKILYDFISPEFSYRSGIISSESGAASGQNQGSGPPNRPLPPTPDDAQGDRTLIMKRVSCQVFSACVIFNRQCLPI